MGTMSETKAVNPVNRKPGGRPKKGSGSRLKVISFRVTEREHEQTETQAESLGLGLATYCRSLVLSQKVEATLIKEANQEAIRQLSRIGNNLNQIAKHYHEEKPAESSLRELLKELRETMRRL